MSKVFLYLYPIKEFASVFVPYVGIDDNKMTDSEKMIRADPFKVLNDTIDIRYRKKGYKVVFAIYPDKDIYGIEIKPNDLVVKTDITFKHMRENFTYPNEEKLVDILGNVDELVVGGYHIMDCVKRVAEVAYERGINTLVDSDLTDLFFNLYNQKDYFDKEIYDPDKFRTYMISLKGKENVELVKDIFDRNYCSPVYGFSTKNHIKGSLK